MWLLGLQCWHAKCALLKAANLISAHLNSKQVAKCRI
jgi:hypothetical protein